MKRILFLLSVVLALFTLPAKGQVISIVQPTVEFQDGSQPLATATPRFSWHYESNAEDVKQTFYRIIVAPMIGAALSALVWKGLACNKE